MAQEGGSFLFRREILRPEEYSGFYAGKPGI